MVVVRSRPWFCSKNGFFANFYFLGHVGQKNVFYEILERRNAFLGYKNNKFKKSKNLHFSKGVNPKMAIFPPFFFLGNIGQENVFRQTVLCVTLAIIAEGAFVITKIFGNFRVEK